MPDFDALDEQRLRARNTVKWNRYPADVLPLWVAEMDFPTAPPVLAAIRAWAEREEFGYPRFGHDALPAATAEWCGRRYGWPVTADQVRVVPDVLAGLKLAIDFLTRPQSPVVLPVPAYMPFFDVLQIAGRQRVEVPMLREPTGRYTLDLAAIEAAFAAGAGSLILCNPYNPLGTAFSAAELRAVVDLAAAHGARIVADEVHAPLVYRGRHVPAASVSPAAAATVVTVLSASKGWNLPGLKCAQVILSNPADATVWDAMNWLNWMGASTVGIAANLAAYRDGEDWLDAVLVHLRGNRDRVADALPELVPGLTVTRPEGTYLAWLDCTALDLPEEPADYLLSHARVALNPGIPFGAGTGCARLNFATTRPILDRAIAAIAAAL
ncbi:aminotransferase class I/II-fold pyridoxal phosphate-dependent enzyme [Mycobacterium sp. 1274756.6]|uniref:MalY/PatB family protein n=1 Tax=Mycobacterium sp. 1274756.6 TaxID=1834076 RepID=UPI0007FBA591|nr:aminotransferase class I/II-fold pyridoxal phosphate-dependent enzyme [Mycobacterium sp. 1274756.6]OBJ74050.1 aminotransferase [Mycobacterium sp. 1274756.6]